MLPEGSDLNDLFLLLGFFSLFAVLLWRAEVREGRLLRVISKLQNRVNAKDFTTLLALEERERETPVIQRPQRTLSPEELFDSMNGYGGNGA